MRNKVETRNSQYPGPADSATGKVSRSAKIAYIHRIQSFLLSLANAERDGRVLITTTPAGAMHLKYQLLNPSEVFSDFSAARSVVIAGGTMAPLSDFAQQLFSSYLSEERIRSLSCAHVVPGSHILARALGTGPSGYQLDFKYEKRNDPKMLDEYGNALQNICNICTKGVVAFVPSYGSLDAFLKRWEGSGLMNRLKSKKSVSSIVQADVRADQPGAGLHRT